VTERAAAAGPVGYDVADLTHLVAKLRRVPDSARNFRCGADWAFRRLRLRGELLDYLVTAGLPHRVVDGERRFDRYDLYNCGLQLGCATVSSSTRRFWPMALRAAAEGRRARYEMQFRMRCPAPHGSDCHYAVALPGGEVFEQTVPAGGPAPGVTIEVSPPVDWPDLPAAARAVLDVVRDLEFLVLREELKRDLDFIRQTRLADCVGTTEILARAAEERGLPVRRSFGYIVVPPFAGKHSWVDLRAEDTWVPVDPLLIETMMRWGALDRSDWDQYRSIGPILARFGSAEVPVARHNGVPVQCTLPTRLLPDRP
jgi:hypothetical protein